jgi:hypothetical protein
MSISSRQLKEPSEPVPVSRAQPQPQPHREYPRQGQIVTEISWAMPKNHSIYRQSRAGKNVCP